MKRTNTDSAPRKAQVINRIQIKFPSLSVNEGLARSAAAVFLAQLDPSVTELADIKCAVSEAVTNCIVHGYRDAPGIITMTVSLLEGRTVKIEIRDKGCGIADVRQARQPLFTTDAAGERSGMGFTVMESFTDSLRVSSKVGKAPPSPCSAACPSGGASEPCVHNPRRAGEREAQSMTEAGGRIAETEVREAVPQEDSAGRFSGNRELLLRARAGDKVALEQLVIDNAGLVRSIAVRFRDRGTDMEDLMQIGTIGMIKAIRSFDTARGTAFSTYAVPLIVGEIRRHFRDDGLIRVSRSCRHLGVCLMRERSRILSEEGREAGIAELAAACGASVEDAAMALDALAPVSSLSDAAYGSSGNGDSPELGAVLPDEAATDELQRETDRIALAQVIAGLPPLWRQIVLLRYYRDMTQQQVADRLGLSQVKVSREEKKIMAFMRTQLEG